MCTVGCSCSVYPSTCILQWNEVLGNTSLVWMSLGKCSVWIFGLTWKASCYVFLTISYEAYTVVRNDKFSVLYLLLSCDPWLHGMEWLYIIKSLLIKVHSMEKHRGPYLGMCYNVQASLPPLELLSENIYFNEILSWVVCMLKFGTHLTKT